MDFWLTDDQVALQAGMRAFVEGRFPLAEIATAEGEPSVLRHWHELAEMGVFSLRADGLGAREAVLVFEELGHGLVPGPLVATHLAAGLVDGAAEGTTVVGLYEPLAHGAVVEHADDATRLLWFDGTWLRQIDTASLAMQRVERPLDALSPVWQVTDTGPPSGIGLLGGDDTRALRRLGVVLTAAMQLGIALGALELAIGYAKQRHQFGRAIGSFQAVKHLLADMLTSAEVARAAVYAAACALDGMSPDDPDRAAHAAKVTAGDAALFCGTTGIQVHGGMGFTWEVNAQRFWKRAVVLDNTFGTVDDHAALI